MKTVSSECSINWTIKQMSALSPSSNQDIIWYMLYQLYYQASHELNREVSLDFGMALIFRLG